MSAPAAFKQADVTRAVRGAQAAGIRIGRVTVDLRGNITIDAVDSRPGRKGGSWDDVLP